MKENCCGGEITESACCAGGIELSEETGTAAEAKFGEFMKTVNSPGAIDNRTKELMAIALSLLSKCEPCVNIHLNKARAMGITEQEIAEAVWMAISFGGAPVMMFYETIREKG